MLQNKKTIDSIRHKTDPGTFVWNMFLFTGNWQSEKYSKDIFLDQAAIGNWLQAGGDSVLILVRFIHRVVICPFEVLHVLQDLDVGDVGHLEDDVGVDLKKKRIEIILKTMKV